MAGLRAEALSMSANRPRAWGRITSPSSRVLRCVIHLADRQIEKWLDQKSHITS